MNCSVSSGLGLVILLGFLNALHRYADVHLVRRGRAGCHGCGTVRRGALGADPGIRRRQPDLRSGLAPPGQNASGRGKKVATNADRIIGQKAMVTEPIDNVAGHRAVSIGGTVWTARSDSAKPIAAGAWSAYCASKASRYWIAPVSAAS